MANSSSRSRSRKRTIQWLLERAEEYDDCLPSVRLTLRDGMHRTIPMANVTHVKDASLWVAELSLPPTIFSVKYSLRMSPANAYVTTPVPVLHENVDHILVLDGNWLVLKFPKEPPIHVSFGNGSHTLFLNHLPTLSNANAALSVTGDTASVGEWNPDWEPCLVKVKNGLWLCPISLEPSSKVEYKLTIKAPQDPFIHGCYDKATGVTWETFYNPFLNRTFTPPDHCNMAVFSSWGEINTGKVTEIPHNNFFIYADQTLPVRVRYSSDMNAVLEALCIPPTESLRLDLSYVSENVEMIGDAQPAIKIKPGDDEKHSQPAEISPDYIPDEATATVTNINDYDDELFASTAAQIVDNTIKSAIQCMHLDIEIARQAMQAKLSIISRGIVNGACKAALVYVDRNMACAMDNKLTIMAQGIVRGAVDSALHILESSDKSEEAKHEKISQLASKFVTDAVGSAMKIVDYARIVNTSADKRLVVAGASSISRDAYYHTPTTYELAEEFFKVHLSDNMIQTADEDEVDRVIDDLTTKFIRQVTAASKEKVAQDAFRFNIPMRHMNESTEPDSCKVYPVSNAKRAILFRESFGSNSCMLSMRARLVTDAFDAASEEIHSKDDRSTEIGMQSVDASASTTESEPLTELGMRLMLKSAQGAVTEFVDEAVAEENATESYNHATEDIHYDAIEQYSDKISECQSSDVQSHVDETPTTSGVNSCPRSSFIAFTDGQHISSCIREAEQQLAMESFRIKTASAYSTASSQVYGATTYGATTYGAYGAEAAEAFGEAAAAATDSYSDDDIELVDMCDVLEAESEAAAAGIKMSERCCIIDAYEELCTSGTFDPCSTGETSEPCSTTETADTYTTMTSDEPCSTTITPKTPRSTTDTSEPYQLDRSGDATAMCNELDVQQPKIQHDENDVVRPKTLPSHMTKVKESMSADVSTHLTMAKVNHGKRVIEQQHSDCTVNRPPTKPHSPHYQKPALKHKKPAVKWTNLMMPKWRSEAEWLVDETARDRSPTHQQRNHK